MLRAALGFFILALIAAIFGAYGVVGLSLEIGRIIVGVFLVMAIIAFFIGLMGGGKFRGPTP